MPEPKPASNPSSLDANPDVTDNVYNHLKNWLLKPADTRLQSYTKTQVASSNAVRQLLFEREGKAWVKFGEGLRLSNRLPPFRKAAEKLADAAFFLYQAFHLGDGRVDDQFVLVQQLHTLLGALMGSYKTKSPTPASNPTPAPVPERH